MLSPRPLAAPVAAPRRPKAPDKDDLADTPYHFREFETMSARGTVKRRDLLMILSGAALTAACAPALKASQQALPDAQPSDSGGNLGADAQSGEVDSLAVAPSQTADAGSVLDSVEITDTSLPDIQPISAITPANLHYVTSCCGSPAIDASAWQVQVLDRGKTLGQFGMGQLLKLPAKTKEHTLECISAGPLNQAISNAIWTGVPLLEVMASIGIAVPPSALSLKFTCADGYTTAVPVSDLQKPMWLVWLMNGQAIPPEHGFPVRLLNPGRYGMKNPKWLTSMEFIDTPYLGFWEKAGWSDTAVYRPQTLIARPLALGTTPPGSLKVYGTAYAGSDAVEQVQVRLDQGPWQNAVLDYAPGADIWVLWHLDLIVTTGAHTVQARCQTANSAQSSDDGGPQDLAGYGGSMSVDFDVA